MIFENPEELKQRIEELAGRRVYGTPRVIEDTTNYSAIYGGNVLRLAGVDYFVTGDATEARFGIDDQPKFWVKYAVDLGDGSRKILKLVFHESFNAKLGPVTVHCVRRPDKESEVLDLVSGDLRFMQGRTVQDSTGNNVRVIERIQGIRSSTTSPCSSNPTRSISTNRCPGSWRTSPAASTRSASCTSTGSSTETCATTIS